MRFRRSEIGRPVSRSNASPLLAAVMSCARKASASAFVLKGEPDGAIEQVRPVLDLPSGLRIATVTGWLADLDGQLADGRYTHVPVATELRQEIREFTATALEAQKAQRRKEGAQ